MNTRKLTGSKRGGPGNLEDCRQRHWGKVGMRHPKPLILAVETSSRIGSVALASGPELLGAETFSASLRHSAEIFPTIGVLLDRFGYAAPDIGQVHIGLGPGSFTGLRIAVTVAKTMHLAHSVAIVTVNSLDTIAANVKDAATAPTIQNGGADRATSRRLATILDAKRGQFYVAVYERTTNDDEPNGADPADACGYRIPASETSRWRKTLADCLMSTSEFLDRFSNEREPLDLVGDGLLYHREAFASPGVRLLDASYWSPHACQVHRLGYQKAERGQFAEPLSLAPLYLRGPQVTLRKAP